MSPDGNRRMDALGYGSELFPLPDGAYALLRDLIVEHTGVLFDAPKRRLLADKLSELVTANGLTSFLDYYYLLRYDDKADTHWSALMNRLAVPETFFWRQAEQIAALADIIAPAHFAATVHKPLRIWSAAACTGDEAISIAIALSEAGLLDERRIQIVATDGSEEMIARARRGVYGERSFRQLPEALKQKYFEPEGTLWRPVERIRRHIRWDIANLVRPAETAPLANADVIFCRNVFIYFSDAAIRSTIQAFAQEMPDDGYLFLGAAESLTRLNVELELAEIGKAFAYVKRGKRSHPRGDR
jgi:chemotaxis protein methyltransferase CheR